jgi:hypothetical protein
MGSEAGRKVFSWGKGPRAYVKCLAIALHREGLRGEALLKEVEGVVPKWRWLFDNEISRNALLQRCDKAQRYPDEAPEKNLKTWASCWPQAKRDAKARKKWTLAELRAEYPDKKPEKMAA